MRSLLDLPPASAAACFSANFAPRFLLTVDTEEEFDWNTPFQRTGHGLDHVPSLRKFQQFCDGYGVSPVYLIDHPIATSPAACDILRSAVASKRAEVGVQLHPWVNPPFSEDVTEYNSFAGNLSPELEHEKFRILHDAIVQNIGIKPLIYRAGRYGLGPHSADILRSEGIAIDSSVRARFDYAAHGGRNYRLHPVSPYWVDDEKSLLELPLTTVFTGPLRHFGDQLHPALWRAPRLRGALAHLRLLDRVPLTPEGVSITEAIRGIDAAIKEQLPILVFSFHSPSLHPGHTPYVRNTDDLNQLYDWWRSVLTHLEQRGILPTTVAEIMASVTR
jgi:hypothetical protein